MKTAHVRCHNLPCKLDAIHDLDTLDDPLGNRLIDHDETLVRSARHGLFVRVVATLNIGQQSLADRRNGVLFLILVGLHCEDKDLRRGRQQLDDETEN